MTTDRYCFLDFDGVVATHSSYRRGDVNYPRRDYEPWASPPIQDERWATVLNPKLVANVDTLCRRVGAVIVLSTSWRVDHPIEQLNRWLQAAGLTAPVVGKTIVGGARVAEITAWCAQSSVRPDQIAILEDAEPMPKLEHRVIRTTFEGPRQGFTNRHLKRALRLFGETS